MNLQRIKDWLINNFLTILTIIAPPLTGIWITIYGNLTRLDLILLILLLTIITLIVIKFIWNTLSYKSYHYPWLKIQTAYNYIVLEKKIIYKRDQNDTLHYSRELEIKCCSNRIDYAFDKYIWTGIHPSTLNITPLRGIASIKHKSKIGIWNYFVMELYNHMGKGETQSLAYSWPDINQCSKSSPFFSTSTDEPTKKIILSLELGADYSNQEIICEEFRAIESDYPIYARKASLDEYGRYTWTIPAHKVKRFRHYRIRWSWCKGQPAAEIE